MKQDKWFGGLVIGVLIGFAIAGLQPLRAADTNATANAQTAQQLNTLIREVQLIRKEAEKSNMNLDKVNQQVGKMATDIKNMASRNDFVR